MLPVPVPRSHPCGISFRTEYMQAGKLPSIIHVRICTCYWTGLSTLLPLAYPPGFLGFNVNSTHSRLFRTPYIQMYPIRGRASPRYHLIRQVEASDSFGHSAFHRCMFLRDKFLFWPRLRRPRSLQNMRLRNIGHRRTRNKSTSGLHLGMVARQGYLCLPRIGTVLLGTGMRRGLVQGCDSRSRLSPDTSMFTCCLTETPLA